MCGWCLATGPVSSPVVTTTTVALPPPPLATVDTNKAAAASLRHLMFGEEDEDEEDEEADATATPGDVPSPPADGVVKLEHTNTGSGEAPVGAPGPSGSDKSEVKLTLKRERAGADEADDEPVARPDKMVRVVVEDGSAGAVAVPAAGGVGESATPTVPESTAVISGDTALSEQEKHDRDKDALEQLKMLVKIESYDRVNNVVVTDDVQLGGANGYVVLTPEAAAASLCVQIYLLLPRVVAVCLSGGRIGTTLRNLALRTGGTRRF